MKVPVYTAEQAKAVLVENGIWDESKSPRQILSEALAKGLPAKDLIIPFMYDEIARRQEHND